MYHFTFFFFFWKLLLGFPGLRLSHPRDHYKPPSGVNRDSNPGPWFRKLVKRLPDIRGLPDRLDASMVSVNENAFIDFPSGSFLNPRVYNCSFLPCRPHPSAENPICPRSNALHHPHTSRRVFSPLRMRRPPQPQLQCSRRRPTPWLGRQTRHLSAAGSPSTTGGRNSGGDAVSASAELQHNTALQEELAAQLAHVAGQLRRNVEHFSGALAADQKGCVGIGKTTPCKTRSN
ncbi:hypothetical protein EDB89DRAFT_1907165 [Lactarius sanguifluus]|nr:hypothetical protein EDB89DRAFT_1907165 [Lactarius sanguifluus]